jgi:Asp-tRNA(Asn)/Glu-tRNA(Gln) amidotransferase A subunit family amidase
MSDPIWLSATEAAGLIKRKRLSPVEYVDAVLRRIERLQPTLNCFATVAPDSARAAARDAEAAVMRGDALGPLHGVPVNIKDLIDTAGIVTAHGSAVYRRHVPARDNVLVTRLKAAGAIVIGKSTTPEFGHKGLTDSPVFGVTRNPWDRTRTAGGSSGGAAAAVASGQGPLGLGTDGAGSIRIPAAACGTVGHKTTLGLVPYEQAGELFANIAYAGPLARTVADAAVMTAAIAGPADSDPWTLRAPSLTTDARLAGGRLDGLRVGYVARMANPAVEPDVVAATEAMLRRLEDLGAIVEPVTTAIDWAEPQGRALYMGNMATNFGRHEAEWADQMDPVMRAYIAEGRTVTLEQYRQSLFARTRLFHAVQGLFASHDLLVTPTLPRGALPADFMPGRDAVVIRNQPVGTTRQGWASYVYPFNLTGHPALTIPSGFTADGLPTGVQLIGRWWSDLDLFRIGALLEAIAPWRDKRPPE